MRALRARIGCHPQELNSSTGLGVERKRSLGHDGAYQEALGGPRAPLGGHLGFPWGPWEVRGGYPGRPGGSLRGPCQKSGGSLGVHWEAAGGTLGSLAGRWEGPVDALVVHSSVLLALETIEKL